MGGRGIAALVALTLALGESGASAAPSQREAVEGHYAAASAAQSPAEAAGHYEAVLELLPEGEANHESRLLALLDAVGSRREAFTRGAGAAQLCAARSTLVRYLDAAQAAHGGAAEGMDGTVSARRELETIDAEIAAADPEACAPPPSAEPIAAPAVTPPAATPAEPAAPLSTRTLVGAGALAASGVALGLMGAGLGLGASAEREARALRREMPGLDIDALMDEPFYARGRLGNRMAIASGAVAAAAMAVGIALLAAGRRSKARAGARAGAGAAGVVVEF